MTDEMKCGKNFSFSTSTPTFFHLYPNFFPPLIFLTPYKASNIKPSSVLLKKARNYFRIK